MRIPTIPVLVLAGVSALSGCAATGDLDSLQQQIEELQGTTQQSLEASRAAEALARQNQADLAAVKRDSSEARRMAEEANARVDQAFSASQLK